MKFNINDNVLVRLTGPGRRVYEQFKKDQAAKIRACGVEPNLEERHPEDPSGWSVWQLWELMSIFGPHLYENGPMMFNTTIIIPEKQQ